MCIRMISLSYIKEIFIKKIDIIMENQVNGNVKEERSNKLLLRVKLTSHRIMPENGLYCLVIRQILRRFVLRNL